MEQLNELEKRVLNIIQANKEVKEENVRLKEEVAGLQGKCKNLESSLSDRSKSTKCLEDEKLAIVAYFELEENLPKINMIKNIV